LEVRWREKREKENKKVAHAQISPWTFGRPQRGGEEGFAGMPSEFGFERERGGDND